MSRTANLHKARKVKNDEFYTRYEDVKEELDHYTGLLEGKKILLPCDGPKSAFVKYFEKHLPKGAEVRNSWLKPDGSGDFRDDDVKELFEWADVIITNPPFSLWREFYAQIEEYGCDFIVVANLSIAGQHNILDKFIRKEIFLGVTPEGGKTLLHKVSKSHEKEIRRTKKQGDAYRIVEGKFFARVPAVFFTSLAHGKRRPALELTEVYTSERYPRYDNVDAIEVSRSNIIPKDYSGVMGVPVSFLCFYNPSQFELLGKVQPRIDNKAKYARLLIRRIDKTA